MKPLQTPIEDEKVHADPITGEHGAHPLGTGIGATVGGVALGVLGAATGPIGAAVGVAVGAVIGGLSGKGFAEGYDPTIEDAYWREQHQHQPYAQGSSYEAYARAYSTGHSGYREGQTFEEREAELQMEYEGGLAEPDEETVAKHLCTDEPPGGDADDTPMPENMRTHSLEWYAAREAARAAYERMRAAESARKATGSKMPD